MWSKHTITSYAKNCCIISKKKRISTWIVAWTNSFMQDKRISFIVRAKQTIMSNVNVDISQKSSMSSILYLFYNANLLKFFKQSSRKMIVIDFMNDINIFLYDINMISNCKLLIHLYDDDTIQVSILYKCSLLIELSTFFWLMI